MVRTGRLIRLYQGVFAVGHSVLRAEGHYLAATLACGPGSALSYCSAGALWNVRASAAALIDVTSPARCGRKKPGLRIHRGDRVLADELTIERGVPCTTVARTLLDLAAVLPGRGLEAAVETSERLGLFDLRSVSILLGRHRGRRGSARLRRVIGAFDAELIRTRSESEARFYCACVEAGLPRPLVNRLVSVGEAAFEVDLHWAPARLILEVDSAFHDTTAAKARDRARDAALRSHGWTVLRRRRPDLEPDPAPLIADLRRRLAPAETTTGAFRCG